MQFDNAEYPMSMDRLVAALGATPIDWAYKVECCGASLALTISDVVVGLVHKIIEDARARGADAIAVACPLCHVNLDSRQKDVEKKFGTKPDMPVLFFTQLMGLAMGIEPAALGLARHLVDVSRLIATVA
jgi:heterodisulfide reductase subunit B